MIFNGPEIKVELNPSPSPNLNPYLISNHQKGKIFHTKSAETHRT